MNDARYTAAMLSQPGPSRYEHFIKRAADFEQVWGLYKDGWAMASTNDGQQVFPVWPSKEFAALCATGDWAACEPKAISVYELIEDVVPTLEEEKTAIGIFPTPNDKGVVPALNQLLADLNAELQRY